MRARSMIILHIPMIPLRIHENIITKAGVNKTHAKEATSNFRVNLPGHSFILNSFSTREKLSAASTSHRKDPESSISISRFSSPSMSCAWRRHGAGPNDCSCFLSVSIRLATEADADIFFCSSNIPLAIDVPSNTFPSIWSCCMTCVTFCRAARISLRVALKRALREPPCDATKAQAGALVDARKLRAIVLCLPPGLPRLSWFAQLLRSRRALVPYLLQLRPASVF